VRRSFQPAERDALTSLVVNLNCFFADQLERDEANRCEPPGSTSASQGHDALDLLESVTGEVMS
jgi:hypothetical protein